MGKLSASLADLGGISNVLTYGRSNDLEFSLALGSEAHPALEYALQLRPDGNGYRIANEALVQQRISTDPESLIVHLTASGPNVTYRESNQQKLVRPIWEPTPFETALSQLPKLARKLIRSGGV